MIRKLQIKFVVIIMSIMSVVLLCIFVSTNISMHKSGEQQSMKMLREIAMNDGKLPFNKRPPNPGINNDRLQHLAPQINFSVKLGENMSITEIIPDSSETYGNDEITALAQSILQDGANFGKKDNFRFLITPATNGSILVFLDDSSEINMSGRLLLTSLGIGSASLVAVFLISLFLSSRAIKPVKKAFIAQKQFVADASHELKTPLTVIGANVDVLVGEVGENKWLSYIHTEIKRMSTLVNDLLNLAKMDSADSAQFRCNFADCNLSELVSSTVLPFESMAYETQIELAMNIEGNIMAKCDESRMRQALLVLLDNALKNTREGGTISVSLHKKGNKKAISVKNSGDGIPKEERARIFERFYRSDSSRARETGGYGLGLSIAKTIVENHKGKISVECITENNKLWTEFLIVI